MSLSSPVRWWFILGREPLLSLAELFAVLKIPLTSWPTNRAEYITPLCRISGTFDEASMVIQQLGGTVKIAAELDRGLSESALVAAILKELRTIEGKIHFGISWYGAEPGAWSLQRIEHWGKEIKKQLTVAGRSVRYIYKGETTLSSVTVAKNGLDKRGREFIITRINGKDSTDSNYYGLAKTIAVQPFEEFSARDFGRPGRDSRSGMLPPKLAMMMINIATASLPQFTIHSSQFTVLDPFCGSGTILTEAVLLSYKNIIGADVSTKAVADTKQNFDWLNHHYSPLSTHYSLQLFQSDVRDLSQKIPQHSVDAIVTEPYLGPPLRSRESLEQIKKNCQELFGLYRDAFVEFKKVLRPGGITVFIIPRFFVGGAWHTISDKLIPELKTLGFTKERLLPTEITPTTYILYHRPEQMVGREIWKFRLT